MKELEIDNNNYKILIENMTKEMESVSTKLMFSNQELQLAKEENLHLRNSKFIKKIFKKIIERNIRIFSNFFNF